MQRRKSGDIVISVNWETAKKTTKKQAGWLSRRLVAVFVWLDDLKRYRVPMTAAMGLGVGCTLAWFVYTQPILTVATSEVVSVTDNQGEATIEAIRFNSADAWSYIAATDTFSVGLDDAGVTSVLVADKAVLLNHNLGDEVFVLGSNNGIYRYRIIEIREMPSDQVRNLTQFTREIVVLHAPTNLLATHQYVVIARPVN